MLSEKGLPKERGDRGVETRMISKSLKEEKERES